MKPSKFWHTFASIGLVVLSIATPAIQQAIAVHPTVTAVFGGIWAILGHLLPSPVAETSPIIGTMK